jgi:hypothetical protein
VLLVTQVGGQIRHSAHRDDAGVVATDNGAAARATLHLRGGGG